MVMDGWQRQGGNGNGIDGRCSMSMVMVVVDGRPDGGLSVVVMVCCAKNGGKRTFAHQNATCKLNVLVRLMVFLWVFLLSDYQRPAV